MRGIIRNERGPRMKRYALLLIVCCAVAFALGATTAKKFPYLSAKLNARANITEVELACLRSRFVANVKPIDCDGKLQITKIVSAPGKEAIEVVIQVQPKPGENNEFAQSDFRRVYERGVQKWMKDMGFGRRELKPIAIHVRTPTTLVLKGGPSESTKTWVVKLPRTHPRP